jgi:hypothetical protein
MGGWWGVWYETRKRARTLGQSAWVRVPSRPLRRECGSLKGIACLARCARRANCQTAKRASRELPNGQARDAPSRKRATRQATNPATPLARHSGITTQEYFTENYRRPANFVK